MAGRVRTPRLRDDYLIWQSRAVLDLARPLEASAFERGERCLRSGVRMPPAEHALLCGLVVRSQYVDGRNPPLLLEPLPSGAGVTPDPPFSF